MKKAISHVGFIAAIFAFSFSAAAQQSAQAPRIGYLSASSPTAGSTQIEAFRQGLRELGYEEGRNITIEYKYAEGRLERLRSLADELVRLKVDVIVTTSTPVTEAAKQATATIPIVFAGVADPVAFGFVASLARPGGNLTGMTNFSPELSGKRVELLKEALPRISRIAVLRDPRQPPNSFKETQIASQSLSLKLQALEIRDATDLETAFSNLIRERADAVITLPHSIFNFHRTRILELVGKNKLPATYGDKEWVEAGGLMSYGPDGNDIRRRGVKYVDKILKGAKPADLPVEQPTKFELVINLKTAKQIGVAIPQKVLARADKVIR